MVTKAHTMTVSLTELDRVVLEAVSDDYESFESLVSKLSRVNSAICRTFLTDQLERSLLTSIANNLVGAYLIHADPPYTTAVGANVETVRRYWFCITDEGKEYLRRRLAKQAVPRRRRLS